MCPHAAIRPALAKPDELGNAPAGFQTVPIRGGGAALKEFQYRVQVSLAIHQSSIINQSINRLHS